MININLRPALEERFGKSKVQEVFGNTIIPCVRVVTVHYKPSKGEWIFDDNPSIDFVDEKRLENFLDSVKYFYRKKHKASLEMQILNYVENTIGYVILGTRDKSMKQYIKDYQDFQKLMEPKKL
ncbi:MAG: hypothetical protein V1815_03235 [Candidatus Woesearchaeota archaeon]